MKEIYNIIKQYEEGHITSVESIDKLKDILMPEIIDILKCDNAIREIIKKKDNKRDIVYILYNTLYK